jgi:hypothetical protein
MSTLKSLVSRSNEGLSFGKKCKQGFGLGDFLAATTEQMLMTRGGYGSPYGYYSGPASWWDPFGGAGGSSSTDSGTGGQHFYEWGLGAQGVGSDQSSSSHSMSSTSSLDRDCQTCNNLYIDQNAPRPTLNHLGVLIVRSIPFFHSSGCDGDYSNNR